MPPKSNKSRNAFYYFMEDFKQRQGFACKSMKDVADAAGPHWARMSKAERRPYEERANKEKGGLRYTWDGQCVEDIERRNKAEDNKIAKMKDDIDCTLKFAKENCRLRDEMFFIIHINTFCYHASGDRYYPAEIAISCFSLEDGVLPQNVFHKIIKPGRLPLGYASDAKKQSEDSHQLPIPLTGDDDDNVEEVYTEMKEFILSKTGDTKKFPPLYAKKDIVKMLQHVLDTWCADFDEPPLFKVYYLQYMFQVLKNSVANDNVWPLYSMAETELDKDLYSHTVGICCEFHSVSEACQFCSKSVAVRLAYTICDNCCSFLDIPIEPGRHVPDQAFTASSLSSRASSKASLYTGSSKSSKKQSVREDDKDTVLSFSSASQWESESVVSDSSTATFNNSFPGLKSKWTLSNSQPVETDSMSQMSGQSYASAMGTRRQFSSAMGNRGSQRESSNNSNNGDTSDSNTDYFNSQSFPALGRGRGMARNRRN
ncbi:protein maelstrom homolog [Diabrotica virgifera virgifera]|uniref:Protein maelstrom homolog n=1 Tax=Diabrotica virgifera virgifera TaxID=50390 RepID=A0A6P7G2W0_DIAVI|nr:protein maelstrom homolog [Diabrotica virgifera virgifera]XP_028143295.1 protein maelstrom homolog [Diabrotica virgifera virgifera]XP_028143296.1 protein maelstrom homolog [Diabrotica virgifera virgifera]